MNNKPDDWETRARGAIRELVGLMEERDELSDRCAALSAAYNQCLTDLEIANGRLRLVQDKCNRAANFLTDYLATHTHPGVSRLLSDIKDDLHYTL